jgi:hypothetical protein
VTFGILSHCQRGDYTADKPVILDFNKTIIKYPSIARYLGGASNDLIPDHPENGG